MPSNGAAPPPPAPSDVRPTVSLRALQEAQAADQAVAPRNEEALAQLRGEVPTATPIAQPLPPVAYAAPPPPPAPETTADIITRLQARRAQILLEVGRLEALKVELTMLDRMIWAAQGDKEAGGGS